MLRKTSKQYKQEFTQAVKKYDLKITLAGVYVSSKQKLEFSCTEHGIQLLYPSAVLAGKGCSDCSRKLNNIAHTKWTTKTYAKRLREIFKGSLVSLSPLVNIKEKLLHKCNLCSHEWECLPSSKLQGFGCPICAIKKRQGIHSTKLGSRSVEVQGYEATAIKYLLENTKLKAKDILVFADTVARTFQYTWNNYSRTYCPDIQIPKKKMIVEVKSPWTLGLYDKDIFARNVAKAKAVEATNHKFRLLMVTSIESQQLCIRLPNDWYLSRTRTVEYLKSCGIPLKHL